jgi:anti-sigma regulatory factor (Ser/Thr protein kinase)
VPDPVNSPGPDADRRASLPLADVWRWRRVFRGDRQELSVLRRWLSSLLPECPSRDDVLSVASELASNAVLHTASGHGGWFAVEITVYSRAVLVAVADCGSSSEPRMIDDPGADHGRGLLMVHRLSVRTGVVGDGRGRLVWAQVPWDPAAPATGTSHDPYQEVVREGEAALARRFAGVPAWFGRSTLAWWAVAGPQGLASAPAGAAVPPAAARPTGPGSRRSAPPAPPRSAPPGSWHGSAARSLHQQDSPPPRQCG